MPQQRVIIDSKLLQVFFIDVLIKLGLLPRGKVLRCLSGQRFRLRFFGAVFVNYCLESNLFLAIELYEKYQNTKINHLQRV